MLLGIYQTFHAYGQYTSGGLKYQITSVEDSGNSPARLDFRGIVINPAQNTTDITTINCYASAFNKDVVIEM